MNPFRLDRFITLKIFSPLYRMFNKADELRIPILMYHSISNEKIKNVHPYYETNTTPKIFADHMKFLFENDYSVISLLDAVKIFNRNNNCLKKNFYNKIGNKSTNRRINYAVITFDDGFRDFYTDAFPILQEYGFSATVFLPTLYVDSDIRFKSKECLTWSQVIELSRKGISFGSHTVNHLELYRLGKMEIEYELKNSKEKIDSVLGKQIESFSYPFAFPDQDNQFITFMKEMLQKCRYKNGVTTRIGTVSENEDPLFLRRIPINSYDDQLFLKAKLEAAYDWIYKFQFFYKKIKRLNQLKA